MGRSILKGDKQLIALIELRLIDLHTACVSPST